VGLRRWRRFVRADGANGRGARAGTRSHCTDDPCSDAGSADDTGSTGHDDRFGLNRCFVWQLGVLTESGQGQCRRYGDVPQW
jgi:hypothetical protein